MKLRTTLTGLCLAAFAMSAPAGAQEVTKGGMDETGPYDVVVGWFKPGIDRWDQRVVSVAADTPNRILIGANDRSLTGAGYPLLTADGKVMAEKTVVPTDMSPAKIQVNQLMVLNGDGKMIENWSQWNDLISIPHSLKFDPYDKERPLWVVDRTGQQILKFSNDGKKLLLKVGENGVAGNDHGHFNEPAGMALMPDGSFYIADGYKNARIIKFDKNGKYQLEWGTPGNGPSQFRLVHAVSVDGNNRVLVSDRANNRIQIFDPAGKLLDIWPNVRAATRVVATEDGSVWVASQGYNRFGKFDASGKHLYHWGMTGAEPGQMDNPHQWMVDQAGNLYVADANNDRVQKFVPRKTADQSHVMQQEIVLKK